ncbi:MAG: sigma-54-dependent Fis family transcriptional regulator, partial [Planctomycetes bacterium]|nr:sigma-54-dependent Fis family transcriptional regulator [Planctomycetota bacterium]
NTLFTQCSGRCFEAIRKTIETNQPAEICRFECEHTLRPRQIATAVTHPLLNDNGVDGAVLVIRDETRLVALERETDERRKYHSIVGKSEKMQKIYTLIEDIANVQSTVLITGESGTGKELVAGALHYRGERRKKPFVLLRVLQEKEFERVGSSTTNKVDVRVIASTNQDLQERIKIGKFREDLYYRLNVIEINLPSLRDRREDIPLLVSHFLDTFNNYLKKSITGISANVQRLFMDYPWQGNIRELEHAIEHACILCRGSLITVEHLPVELRKYAASKTAHCEALETDERLAILQALEASSWNVTKAARKLGIGRRTIYRKIELYQIKHPGH